MGDQRTSEMDPTTKEASHSPQAGTTPSGPAPQGPGQGEKGGDTYQPGQGGVGGGGYQPGQSEMAGGRTSRPTQDSTRGTDTNES